ncbi:MAG: alkaline phosphatase family protein [Nocardioides sp.]|nr:alkaline phosphatase family protein [Nocardioides sp.]
MMRSLAAALTLTCSMWVLAPAAVPTPAPAPSLGAAPTARVAEPVTQVLAISVDGLNPAALRRLGTDGAPNLHRFRRAGASTLNARSAVELTLTLPNHTGMVTGRRINRRRGGHGVTWNDDRRSPATVQEAAGHPVDSVFSTIRAAGGNSALFASKTKFSLWQRSWPDGLQRVVIREDNGALVGLLERDLARTPRTFRMLHLSLPDVVGHERGFMSRAYLRAVRRVDALVGRVVRAVRSDAALRTSTAMILTSDHGGRGATHGDQRSYANYRVAFMVRGPGIPLGADLYALNPDYAAPGRTRPGYLAERQPVRNAAVANLALDLLGLGPVPGSAINADQDLDVS